jgi:transposase
MTLEEMKKILDKSSKSNSEFVCIAIEFPFKKIPQGDIGTIVGVNLKKRSFTVICTAGRFEAKESEIDMVEYMYHKM